MATMMDAIDITSHGRIFRGMSENRLVLCNQENWWFQRKVFTGLLDSINKTYREIVHVMSPFVQNYTIGFNYIED